MNYEIKGRPQRHCNFQVGAVGSACLSLWRLGTRLPGLTCKQRCAMIPSAAATAKSLQSCPTLCDPIDGSPPGSPVPGILQARTLEWVAISFSNAWKWKVKVKLLNCIQPSATSWTAAFQAPPSMGVSRQEYWSGVPLPSPWFPLPPVKKPAATYNTVPTDLFTLICYYSLRVVGSWHSPLLPPHLWPHSILQSLLPQAEPGMPPASHLLSPSHTPSSFWALFPGVKLPNDLIPWRTLSSQWKQTVSATHSLLKPNPVNNTVHFKIQNCTFHILSPQIECRIEASNVFISLPEPQTQSGFNSCGESFFNEKESCRSPVIS